MAATDEIPNPLDSLALDANGDGQLTSADVSDWLGAAFFLPGDGLLWALSTYAAPLASLLDLGAADYGSVSSAFFSLCAWLAAAIALNIAYHFVLDVDLRITTAIKRAFTTLTVRLRIARILLLQRWRARARI
jgi:hypothetical protein